MSKPRSIGQKIFIALFWIVMLGWFWYLSKRYAPALKFWDEHIGYIGP